MIENRHIDLSKESLDRTNAINSVKYTLLLDYSQLETNLADEEVVKAIMQKTRECCTPRIKKNSSQTYKFFGDSRFEAPNKYLFLDADPVSGINNLGINSGLVEFILQHCLFSSYHALVMDLFSNASISLYTLSNKFKDNGDIDFWEV